MRPIAKTQNPLMFPLNRILRTEGGVRTLRVLSAETEGALGLSDIAQKTGLTVAGVCKVIERLLECGIVVNTSAGRGRQYALSRNTPLVPILASLFQWEQNRYNDLLNSLHDQMRGISPRPESVWVEQWPQEPGDPLVIGLLHSSRYLAGAGREARRLLTQIESEFDITIELNCYTKADLSDHAPHWVTLLLGVPPPRERKQTKRGRPRNPHSVLDKRSLERCHGIVSLIGKNRSLIVRARRHVQELLREGQGAADHDLREWLMVLESYSLHRLLKFLVSDTPRAVRLRQSCPFFAVLSDAERVQLKEE